MRFVLISVAVLSVATSAFAQAAPVPEIDGSLAIQVAALVGGLALIFKKKIKR